MAVGEESDTKASLDRVLHVCSDELDHRKLICDDAGPGYVESMSLKWTTVRRVFEGADSVGCDLRLDASSRGQRPIEPLV